MIYVIAGNIKQFHDYCKRRGVSMHKREVLPLVMPTDLFNTRWKDGDELVVTGHDNRLEPRFRDWLVSAGMPSKNA